jgi:hypothetical protein
VVYLSCFLAEIRKHWSMAATLAVGDARVYIHKPPTHIPSKWPSYSGPIAELTSRDLPVLVGPPSVGNPVRGIW